MLVRGIRLVLPWPPEVVGSGPVVLGSDWGGRSSKHRVEASGPVYCDSGSVSDLLPGVGVWDSTVYFSCNELP